MVFVKLAVTLGAAWLILHHVDWGMLLALLARADPIRLALGGFVLSAQFIIMVWRWRIVITLLGGPTVAMDSLAIALGRGMIIGQPLPSTLGGDVVRMVMLSRQIGFKL